MQAAIAESWAVLPTADAYVVLQYLLKPVLRAKENVLRER